MEYWQKQSAKDRKLHAGVFSSFFGCVLSDIDSKVVDTYGNACRDVPGRRPVSVKCLGAQVYNTGSNPTRKIRKIVSPSPSAKEIIHSACLTNLLNLLLYSMWQLSKTALRWHRFWRESTPQMSRYRRRRTPARAESSTTYLHGFSIAVLSNIGLKLCLVVIYCWCGQRNGRRKVAHDQYPYRHREFE